MNISRLLIMAAAITLLSLLALAPGPALAAASIVVDSNLDTNTSDNVLTLREAVLLANGGTGGDGTITGLGRALDGGESDNVSGSPGAASADTITFSGAVTTIALGTNLPAITEGGDTIDGSATGEVIQGAEARTFSCIIIFSAGNTIKGLTITDCLRAIELSADASDNNTIGPGNTLFDNGSGIFATTPAAGNTIIGNKIGTNAAGTAIPAEGGNTTGVFLFSGGNTIGGTAAADRNIIAGNGAGIIMSGAGAAGNDVYGNFIGTDVTGTADLGNSGSGVNLNGASSNTIGGVLEGQGNLISGNDNANVQLTNESDGNTFQGNLIGPNINGGGNLASGDGITLGFGSSGNTVGPGNVISDNIEGLVLSGSGTSGNVVKGNLIGTNVVGTAALPNTVNGILVSNSAGPNTIGGTSPGDGNVIAFNLGSFGLGDGVRIDGSTAPAAAGNAVRANSIHDNGGLEIANLNGGNFQLAPPTVDAAGSNAAGGSACANCWVDVFSDGASDAEFFEGSVQADGSGQWALHTAIVGPNVTATNTDSSGNTSQLSSARPFDAESDADGVPNPLDNCPIDANANQSDADGDGAGDDCDTDDDDDSLLDGSDSCPVLAEDFDGFEDTNGCPDPDNDLDGVCDAGQSNVSCAGSDSGKACFDPAGTLSCPTIDCRNVAEDVDAFHDSDGCPEPDNDNDGFPDTTDACPGTDAHTGGDAMLGAPQDLNHNGVRDDPPEAAFVTDDIVLVFEDYDGVLDGDGCHDSPGDDFDGDGLTDDDEVFFYGTLAFNPDSDGDTVIDGSDNCPIWPNPSQSLPRWAVPPGDPDCDGWTSALETAMGSDPQDMCADTLTAFDERGAAFAEPPSPQPPDFNDDRFVDVIDVNLMGPPIFNVTQGKGVNPFYNARLDLNADDFVDITDVNLMGPPVFNVLEPCPG